GSWVCSRKPQNQQKQTTIKAIAYNLEIIGRTIKVWIFINPNTFLQSRDNRNPFIQPHPNSYMPEINKLLKEIDENHKLMSFLLDDKICIMASEDLNEMQWISRLETVKTNQEEVLAEFKAYLKEMNSKKKMASARFSQFQKRQKTLLETLKKFGATQ
ncbi:MAG: hypothetical protein Q7S21_00810, partial [archaeon]|nr:hypothetical protein [archaeon]